ncbi:MAG: Holliday junction resolvase RuvX [Saprospiraceae bacterium]
MARILGIDYGEVRCGLAVTDPLQIIVNSLIVIPTSELKTFILIYCKKEKVEKIVFGLPKHKDGNDTHLVPYIKKIAYELVLEKSDIVIDFQDESYTSFEAKSILLKSGIGKQKRKEKSRIDEISAVLILQKYLGHI